MERQLSPFCATFTRAVEIVGRRWTGAILRAMLAGRSRFGEIADTVPGLSDRVLSARLKELEAEGIVRRSVTPTTPVGIRYSLTEMGAALAPVVWSVESWAQEWVAPRIGADAGC